MPKISIITVVYNGALLIEKTIESIIGQSFEAIEYIIIDGNSKDDTVKIIEKYGPRITKWISEPDKGLYDAMNKGLKMATGDYVLYINAGDELAHAKIIENIFTKNPPADIYYSDTILIKENGDNVGLMSESGHRNAPEQLTWQSMGRGMVVCHQSFIARRSLAPQYDEVYRISADQDWVIKCLKAAKGIHKIQEPISKFMQGGISTTQNKKAVKERFFLYQKHFGLLRNLYNHIFIAQRVLTNYLSNQNNNRPVKK